MIQHVYERCQEAGVFGRLVVATDDQRIADVARAFGAEVMMTSPACASGTDRVAEVARALGGADDEVFINVQGDEPALHPSVLTTLAAAFARPSVEMATLVRPLREDERANSNVVKVVLDEADMALYFSRHDVPFARTQAEVPRWAHVGLYAYRRQTLLRLASLAPTALERAESLEQLRALGHGVRIACCMTRHESVAVDRPEDVPAAEAAVLALTQAR